jgi:ribosomal protein L37AE/L43A
MASCDRETVHHIFTLLLQKRNLAIDKIIGASSDKRSVSELNVMAGHPHTEEMTMKRDTEPWHELVYVCPHCRKEFIPEAIGLHVRLCPECQERKAEHASLMKKAAKYATSTRATTSGLLETIVGNR